MRGKSQHYYVPVKVSENHFDQLEHFVGRVADGVVGPEECQRVLLRVGDVLEVGGALGVLGVKLRRDVDAEVEHGVTGHVNQPVDLFLGGRIICRIKYLYYQ